MKRAKIIAGAGIGAMLFTGCSTVSTAPDEVAIHVGGGPLEKAEVKGCVEPSVRQNFNSFADNYYFYPANQRTFDFTGRQNSDREPFSVVSKDNQTVSVPGSVEFSLNTECDVLVPFHIRVGSRHQAYNTESGQPTSEGWAKMLDLYLGRAVDATLDRVAKKYTWRELHSDPSIRDEMNKEVNATIAAIVNQQFNGDEEFFTGFSALIQQPVADETLLAILKDEEASRAAAQATEVRAVADAEAAKKAAEAQVSTKEAEAKIAELEAEIRKAEMAPFESVQQFNDYMAITKGINPYQPTYIVGGVPPK